MQTCAWCGSRNENQAVNCQNCGGPLGDVVPPVVYVDLSGVKGPNVLNIRRLIEIAKELLPGARFTMNFKTKVATFTPKVTTSQVQMGGAYAHGVGAKAVGAGGVLIEGNVNGSISMGRHQAASKKTEPERFTIWLPSGVKNIIIAGNGQTRVSAKYQTEFDLVDAEME